MSFKERNTYYLRISNHSVLPLLLYLDDRHVEWMSDLVLQRVLEDLRPNILPKLRAESDAHLGPGGPASAKKGTVDTHRGDTYQFCYFLRKTQQHSILTKRRNYVTAPPKPAIPVSRVSKGKRKAKKIAEETQVARKKRKTKGKGRAVNDGSDDEYESEGSNSEQDANAMVIDAPASALEPDMEEEKPKPIMQVAYQGFNIFGHSLCVIVEPWPLTSVRAPSEAPSTFRAGSRALSEAPSAFAREYTEGLEPASRREATPLFLPDWDERGRSTTPVPPSRAPDRVYPPVPLFDDAIVMDEEDNDLGGMMELSQVLNVGRDVPRGGPALDDDDDMEGYVFAADADERREL